MRNIDELKERARNLPQSPGVYLMKNREEKIIYVGKAKNLKNRVSSYFTRSQDQSTKTQFLVRQIHHIEYLLTNTEVEAFLLEASLIKKHRPRYNIRLKDDKAYPYIKVTWQEDFPRLYLARRVKKDGGLYFGPYTSGYVVRETIRFLNKTFQIRDCTDHFFKSRKRPCMTHQIGRCTAPCVGLVDSPRYKADVQHAVEFLRGENQALLKRLHKRMKVEAAEERFEIAARHRDAIQALETILERQTVVQESRAHDIDQDVFGFYGDDRGVLIEGLHIRKGRMIGNRSHFFPLLNPESADEDTRDWMTSFLNQYYEDNFIPDEIILPVDLGRDLTKLLEAVLKERRDTGVKVSFGTADGAQDLIDMANENAKSHFADYVSKSERKKEALELIQKKLGLPELPFRIECYDISNIQGQETVASQVVFEDGIPNKDQYRRYKIRTVEGPNDYAAMREVIGRRLRHTEYEDPQLIVIDGGKGQLRVAVEVLKELKRTDIPVVSLAKARTQTGFQHQEVERTEERFFIPGRQNPVVFREGTEAYKILVGIRDEAHRFAITYHRKLREGKSLESELDTIPGLGEQRKKDLLTAFESIEQIRDASIEDLIAVKGISESLAERILQQLNDV